MVDVLCGFAGIGTAVDDAHDKHRNLHLDVKYPHI
jgi:hypothetical protein